MTLLTTDPNTEPQPTQDDIDSQERDEIAGLPSSSPLQVEEKYQLYLDSEVPSPKPIEERGFPRAVLVMGIIGGLMLLGFGVWLVIQPKPPVTTLEPDVTPSPASKNSQAAEPDYRAKLALQNQKYDFEQSKTAKPSESQPDSTPKPKPPAAPKTRNLVVRRQPVPSSPSSRHSLRVPASAQPIPKFKPIAPIGSTAKSDPVDALKRWNELANLGQSRGVLQALNPSKNPEISSLTSSTKAQLRPSSSSTQLVNRLPKESTNSPKTIPAVNLSLNRTPSSSDQPSNKPQSPGTYGILNRRATSSQLSQSPLDSPREIAFGTTAAGTVSVPLIWDTANSPNSSANPQFPRFAITLTEDLKATNGTVALAAGTVLVAEVTSVTPGSLLVTTSAIAIVSTDGQGSVQQRTIDPGLILIHGADSQPLIAQNQANSGGEILQQDLTISLLSGLGKVGKVFTEPEQTTTINGTFGTTTTNTRSRNPEIWSAVLDGFFNPLSERMSERSQKQISELLRRPTVAVIPVGTSVSIITNGFITIER